MKKNSVGLLELETAVLECFLEKTPLSPLGVKEMQFNDNASIHKLRSPNSNKVLTLKISSDQIWVAGYFGQPLTYPYFTIFSSNFISYKGSFHSYQSEL
jgi:hypothetical protein